jgi:hypothetical protein
VKTFSHASQSSRRTTSSLSLVVVRIEKFIFSPSQPTKHPVFITWNIVVNREEISESKETGSINDKQSESVRQDMPLDDSNIIPENSGKDLDRKPILHRESSDYGMTYIGIGIGILGMAVIMLVLIIYIILRKNRHQIFSKNSSKFSIFSFSFNLSYIFFSFQKSSHKASK